MIVLSHKMADNYGVPDVDNEVRNWDPYAQDAPGSLPETRRALEETAALVIDKKKECHQLWMTAIRYARYPHVRRG